jgi:hypothetical protein
MQQQSHRSHPHPPKHSMLQVAKGVMYTTLHRERNVNTNFECLGRGGAFVSHQPVLRHRVLHCQ